MVVELAPELLKILACPSCRSALAVDHDADELVCTGSECGLAYPVRDQIPVLLVDEARRPGRVAPAGSDAGEVTPAEAGSDEADAVADPEPPNDSR